MDFKNPDFLWATVDIAIWSDIEQGLAITAGSLATLRPLYRQLASKIGLTSTGPDPSKPTGMRTPQWNGVPSNESRKKSGFMSLTNTLLRMEKGTVTGTVGGNDEEYGMGDLQPIRLRDDLCNENSSEKSDKGFNTWSIQAGKVSDEECRAGTITMHNEIFQQSDRRSAGKF